MAEQSMTTEHRSVSAIAPACRSEYYGFISSSETEIFVACASHAK